MKKFTAFQGAKFTIEWYVDNRGKSSVQEYFLKLPSKRKDKVTALFMLMGKVGKIFNKEKFRYEGNQIFAFKPSPDRFLCFFFTKAKIIVTNAFEKKTSKLPKKEKNKSLKLMNDYIKRIKEGSYYE